MVNTAAERSSLPTIITLTAFGIFLTFHQRGYNLDSTLILEQSRRLLQGRWLEVDFVAPLIIYLQCIPVLLAQWFHLPVWYMFNALVALATIYSIVAVTRRIRTVLPEGAEKFILLGFIIAYSYIRNSWDFGQRDYFFIILYLPYFFQRTIHLENSKLYTSVIVGVLGAIGACLKPQFFIVALLIELWWQSQTKTWKTLFHSETLAFFITSAIYWFHFLFLPHEIRTMLFGNTLPMLIEGYSAYNQSLFSGLMSKRIWIVIVVVITAWLLRKRDTTVTNLLKGLSLLSLLCVGVYFQQHKFYSYHNIPAFLSAVPLALLVLLSFPWWKKIESVFSGWVVCFSVILVMLLAMLLTPYEPVWEKPTLRAMIERDTKPGDPVLILSTTVNPAFPMLFQLDRQQATRFLFPVQFAIFNRNRNGVYPTPERMKPQECEFFNQLALDIQLRKPKLIAIRHERGLQGVDPEFDLYEYLNAVNFIESIKSGYSEGGMVEGYEVFYRTGM